jgi:hypothetical protein
MHAANFTACSRLAAVPLVLPPLVPAELFDTAVVLLLGLAGAVAPGLLRGLDSPAVAGTLEQPLLIKATTTSAASGHRVGLEFRAGSLQVISPP